MTMTDRAAERARGLIANAPKPVIGLRVGVRSKGCSGLSYAMEFAKTHRENEEVVEDKGVKLLIEPTAVMYIIGSELDYRANEFEQAFVFENPNKTGSCGCGESFSTDKQSGSTGGGCCS